MQIDISPAMGEDKSLIQRMMELYLHDFSEMDGADLDAHGCYGYPYLDHYWVEEGRFPFIVRVDGRLAGFVLVNQHTLTGADHAIAEFFVMRKYRRRGVGKAAAFRIFDLFPGWWEVRQIEANHVAQGFWRHVIGIYTAGQFEEIALNTADWRGPAQRFHSSGSGGRRVSVPRPREDGV